MKSHKTTINLTQNPPWLSNKKINGDESLPFALDALFIKRIPLWKRVFDIICALGALLVLCPLLAAIAVLIKTVSPGPVFFMQKRVGCGGKVFNCLKFRTMDLSADPKVHEKYLAELITSSQANCNPGDPMKKLPKDPRIIKYGFFLRASGLDELPQLINVLQGHMSLVGPRPPIPYEVKRYKHWYKTRFDVTPGLTGLWQVSGKNKLGFNEMIRLDIQYAKKRSLLLDCKILLMTFHAVYLQIKEMKDDCS
ncbi:MAG: sugar transferase [Desulfobacteraceae bacterium]|nr:sugar transferase [Desulfobacteraceae bacterium]